MNVIAHYRVIKKTRKTSLGAPFIGLFNKKVLHQDRILYNSIKSENFELANTSYVMFHGVTSTQTSRFHMTKRKIQNFQQITAAIIQQYQLLKLHLGPYFAIYKTLKSE